MNKKAFDFTREGLEYLDGRTSTAVDTAETEDAVLEENEAVQPQPGYQVLQDSRELGENISKN